MTDPKACEKFNEVQWHDSKLRSFAVVRKDDGDAVILNLEVRGMSEGELTPATLTLSNTTYLRVEMDLDGKYQCADDISSARCQVDSALRDELLRSQFKHSPSALDGYYHFDLYLIPPGGRIQVFAKEFELKVRGAPE
jgi:hypothetical protein